MDASWGQTNWKTRWGADGCDHWICRRQSIFWQNLLGPGECACSTWIAAAWWLACCWNWDSPQSSWPRVAAIQWIDWTLLIVLRSTIKSILLILSRLFFIIHPCHTIQGKLPQCHDDVLQQCNRFEKWSKNHSPHVKLWDWLIERDHKMCKIQIRWLHRSWCTLLTGVFLDIC